MEQREKKVQVLERAKTVETLGSASCKIVKRLDRQQSNKLNP